MTNKTILLYYSSSTRKSNDRSEPHGLEMLPQLSSSRLPLRELTRTSTRTYTHTSTRTYTHILY
eukprot:scaffold249154_cov35-Attheya_sp.AAC.1